MVVGESPIRLAKKPDHLHPHALIELSATSPYAVTCITTTFFFTGPLYPQNIFDVGTVIYFVDLPRAFGKLT
jgi:hypothetical protein